MTYNERNNRIKDSYLSGKSLAKVGEEFKLTRARVYQILIKMGVKARTKSDAHPPRVEKEYLEKEYLENRRSINSISEELSVSPGVVYNSIRKHGLIKDKESARMDIRRTIGTKKLTKAFILEGLITKSASAMAREAGTSANNFFRICRSYGIRVCEIRKNNPLQRKSTVI